MRASIDVNLGGRVAEELVFGSDQASSCRCSGPTSDLHSASHDVRCMPGPGACTGCLLLFVPAAREPCQQDAQRVQVATGASHDFETATRLAREMVCTYGFSGAIGPVHVGKDASPELRVQVSFSRLHDQRFLGSVAGLAAARGWVSYVSARCRLQWHVHAASLCLFWFA